MASRYKRQAIPAAIRRELAALPCAVCGVPFDIHCDHVIPVARGGQSTRGNLQPLCSDCNYAKKHMKTNADVRLVIATRGYPHFLKAVFRQGTRHVNAYDAPTLADWCESHPSEVALATNLYLQFLKRGAHA